MTEQAIQDWALGALALRREIEVRLREVELGSGASEAVGRRLQELPSKVNQVLSGLSERHTLLAHVSSWRLRRAWRKASPGFELAVVNASLHKAETLRLELLRAIRTEVLDLRRAMTTLRTGKSTLETYADFMQKTRHDIRELVNRLNHVDDGLNDELRHLNHLWEQIDCELARIHRVAPANDARAKDFELVDGLCRELVFVVAYRTIPDRLSRWLARAWAGSSVSFHEVFEDELPEYEDRQKLLSLLAQKPTLLACGLIDLKTGLVYRYNTARSAQLRSLVILIGSYALTTAVLTVPAAVRGFEALREVTAPAGTHAAALDAVNGSAATRLLASCLQLVTRYPQSTHWTAWWIALTCGVLFHVAADKIKIGSTSMELPVGHLAAWADARLGRLLGRFVIMFAGFVGALVMFNTTLNDWSLGMFTMFLVGYGLDSFVGIFVASIEGRAAALAQAGRSNAPLTK